MYHRRVAACTATLRFMQNRMLQLRETGYGPCQEYEFVEKGRKGHLHLEVLLDLSPPLEGRQLETTAALPPGRNPLELASPTG